jgi:integrase
MAPKARYGGVFVSRGTPTTAKPPGPWRSRPNLITTLRALKLATPYSHAHDRVSRPRPAPATTTATSAAVERAGLEAVEGHGVVVQPAPVFHALRDSHASRLIAAGWDIEEVSARLGHANVATTQQTYMFDAAKRSDERRNRLAKLCQAPR